MNATGMSVSEASLAVAREYLESDYVKDLLAGTPLAGFIEELVASVGFPRAPHRLSLSRSIVSWDTETTGVDPVLDRLVSIGVTVLNPDETRRRWETLINPEMSIPPEVTEIHGITDEMVTNAPKFRDIAAKFAAGLRGKDMLLYNGRRLDLPIVDEELRRCGSKLDLSGVVVIDAFGSFCKKEPRDLSAFVKRYTGRITMVHMGPLRTPRVRSTDISACWPSIRTWRE